MCPDWGSNPQPFGVQDDAPTNGATWPGHWVIFLYRYSGTNNQEATATKKIGWGMPYYARPRVEVPGGQETGGGRESVGVALIVVFVVRNGPGQVS